MTYWKLISTGDPVQTSDPVGVPVATSPARTGTGETGKGPVGHLIQETTFLEQHGIRYFTIRGNQTQGEKSSTDFREFL
jgi:hypothetical protein